VAGRPARLTDVTPAVVTPSERIDNWTSLGQIVAVGADRIFVIDAPATGEVTGPPLLVLHGFPTSSIDFSEVLGALQAGRRVVLLDMPGYGLSTKIDRRYSLFDQADRVESVVAGLGLTEVDLLTHDMGDSVGGELLARSLDDTLGFAVRRRVLTNGSIYIAMAQLTAGQQFLLAMPDEMMNADTGSDADGLTRALFETMAPTASSMSEPHPDHVRAAAELIVRDGGARLLSRTIRYIEDRRRQEDRFTGAIERHPSPLTIVWGDLDPIAVWPMTDQLIERRPDAVRVRLEGVGHYPMVEAPVAFATAVVDGL
jgi:pimeloyl-ACP methyl ester carboxylesterase